MSQDALAQLTALCAQLRDAERELTAAEKQVKDREADIRRLTEEDIPALMTELGVEKIVLASGEQIKVALEVYAQIPKDSKEAAFAWLEENGHGGLIKTDVSVAFGREELPKAQALAVKLAEEGLEPMIERTVHAGTLKAFIKERLNAGATVPLELFGARPVNTAKIKNPS